VCAVLQNYDTALELFTKVTDHVAAQPEDKARAFANLAALYLKRNQIPEALDACNRSLDARLRTSSSHRDVLIRVAEHYAGVPQPYSQEILPAEVKR
jgi:tetratricopeptide (TPR) repeat protein